MKDINRKENHIELRVYGSIYAEGKKFITEIGRKITDAMVELRVSVPAIEHCSSEF